MGEFVPLHFTETMIDHLEIDSVIHHVDSDEARAQVKTKPQEIKLSWIGIVHVRVHHANCKGTT